MSPPNGGCVQSPTAGTTWVYWIGALLAAHASRLSEYEADAAAARWGYGDPLARALHDLSGPEPPGGRLARLTASHPPTSQRVQRLHALAGGGGGDGAAALG